MIVIDNKAGLEFEFKNDEEKETFFNLWDKHEIINEELKVNESICTNCDKKTNDDTETKWGETSPYCEKCFKEKELIEVLNMCLSWYEEAPIKEIEAVEKAINQNFPYKEIKEVIN